MTEVIPLSQEELDASVEQFEEGVSSQLKLLIAAYLAQQAAAAITPAGFITLSGLSALWTANVVNVLINDLAEIYDETVMHVRRKVPNADEVQALGLGIDRTRFEFFISQARQRLSFIGQHLTAHATEIVTAGIQTESFDNLLMQAVEESIPHAAVIARSEAVAVANLAALTEMQLLASQFNYEISKKWFDSNDSRVRPTHEIIDGTVVPINVPFNVGGFPLMYPGDSSGPPALVRNCRCRLGFDVDTAPSTLTAADDDDEILDGWIEDDETEELVGRMPRNLRRYWLRGPGAAKIRWGTPGDFTRCVRNLRRYVRDPKGTCANLHKDATGMWPGDRRNPGMSDDSEFDVIDMDDCGCTGEDLALDDREYSGAMIALVPSESDAQRLVVDGGLSEDDLHTTLLYLGEASEIPDNVKEQLVTIVEDLTRSSPVISGSGFAVSLFNPAEDDSCVVLGMSGVELSTFHQDVQDAINDKLTIDEFGIPEQHEPWIPHITLGYCREMGSCDPAQYVEKVGTVTYDRVRLAFGNDIVDVPLGNPDIAELPEDIEVPEEIAPEGEMMTAALESDVAIADEASLAVSESGLWEGVLTVEGRESGDGRMFAPESLTWPDPQDVVLNLSWQPASAAGHDYSYVVGRIDEIWRDGESIRGRGRFDVQGEHGSEAFRLVSSDMLRGISVDVDSVKDADIEYVFPEGESEVEEEDIFSTFGTPELTVFKRGRIRGATLVPIPAFVEAQISLVASSDDTEDEAMESDSESFGAVRSHDTATSDGPWDADANVGRLPSPMSSSTARNMYAWIADNVGDEVNKADCKFPHHNVSEDGTPGAANLTACSAGIAALHGARGGTNIPSGDRRGVYDHLARHLRDGGKEPPPFEDETETMAASAHVITIPSLPPAEWFSEPTDVDVHGALTVTDQGRVYGYLAPKGVAHRGFANKKVTVPMGNVDYSNFMRGETLVDGGRVRCGVITMNCGHMSPFDSSDSEIRAEHYDNTCSVVANIAVGENNQGVWVAGALMPGVSPDQVLKMMSCQLSGDWSPHREKRGMRELNAALLVPRPGFPFARSRASVEVEEGQLVASSVPVEFVRTEDCAPCKHKEHKQLSVEEQLEQTRRELNLAQKKLIMMRVGRDKNTRKLEIMNRIKQLTGGK